MRMVPMGNSSVGRDMDANSNRTPNAALGWPSVRRAASTAPPAASIATPASSADRGLRAQKPAARVRETRTLIKMLLERLALWNPRISTPSLYPFPLVLITEGTAAPTVPIPLGYSRDELELILLAERICSSAMRVAIFHCLPSGGARRAMVEMAKQLLAEGSKIDFFLTSNADEEFLPSNLPGVGVRMWRTEPWEGFGTSTRAKRAARMAGFVRATRLATDVHKRMAAEIDEGAYDLAFVHHDRVMQSPALLRFLTTPSVYYCQEPIRAAYEHDLAPGSVLERTAMYFPKLGLRDRDRQNARAADSVLVNSFFSRESILRAYGIEAKVMYLGVDPDIFTVGDRPRDHFALSVGAIHPQKGHRVAIRTLGSIPRARRPSLVVVGDRGVPGETDLLSSLAAEHDVELKVKTRVSEQELVDLYRRAAVLLCFQRLEPFGLVALEAAACGTPTVGIREGGLRESIVEGVTGVLVDSRDPAELGEAVDGLLSDRDEWRRLSATAAATVREGWTWQHTGARLQRHLADVVKRHDRYPPRPGSQLA